VEQGGGLRIFRKAKAPKLLAAAPKSVKEYHFTPSKALNGLIETLPLRSLTRSKFPRLAAKFANYRFISGDAYSSGRLFKPFSDAAALALRSTESRAAMSRTFQTSPLGSSLIGYAPALRTAVPGKMPFSTMASIARSRMSDASGGYGWARLGALGLFMLKSDDDEVKVEAVELCVRPIKRSTASKTRRAAGKGVAKAISSKYLGAVRNASVRAVARKVSPYKDLMWQAAWGSIKGSKTALAISMYNYGVWDLEGFIPSSMLWCGAVGTVSITPASIDCLRRALDVDGTLAKVIACLDEFHSTGEIDQVAVEISNSGEISLTLVFPPHATEPHLRQKLSRMGLDPDDHIFEFFREPARPLVDDIHVVFVPSGPPTEMEFDDEWEEEVRASVMSDESWLGLPPSEYQQFDGFGMNGVNQPVQLADAFSESNVWDD
jgi:hypothetical protein